MELLSFLHFFISFYSFGLLCIIPYTDRLIRSKSRVFTELIICCLAFSILPIILDKTSYSQASQIVSIVFYFSFFFYYKNTVQDGYQKLLFVTFLGVHMLCMGTELEFSITTLTGDFPLPVPTPANWYAMFIPVRIVLYLIVCFIMYYYFTPRLRQIKANDMKGLLALPLIFAFISIYRGAEYYYKSTPQLIYPTIFMMLAVVSFVVYWQMLRTLDSVTKNARLEADIKIQEQILASELAAYDRQGKMKEELIATITHETLTPLAVLSGYAELVAMELRRKGVDEQAAKDLDNIAEETQRISWLMDELQNHIRSEDHRRHKTKLDLSKLIVGVVRLYTPIMARIYTEINLNLPDDLPNVYACASEITQVLFNVLQNARNHTEKGKIKISAETKLDSVLVTITDTGSGIPDQLLPHVFERGISDNKEGNGLGLPICKEIIENHNGEIYIKSEYGKGTTLCFTLPIWKDEINE